MFEGVWLLLAGLIVVGMLFSLFIALWLTLGMLKAFFYWTSAVLLATSVMVGLLAWGTRIAAVPGNYRTDGVWGTSTLVLRSDHTATQRYSSWNTTSLQLHRKRPRLTVWTSV